MSVIKTEKITKIYQETKVPVHALNGVDMDIREGEFSAIVGPSGSGKSTLLNIIGGLDSPTDGNIEVNGTDITKMKDSAIIDFRLKNIGFVFQSYNLIPVLTAKENVEFIMLLQKRPKEEREARVMELLKAVGLEEKANSRPNELSGGQQQRVAVARALASRPKFILADDLMAKMNEKEKVTFIFSTHDQRVIDRARRVLTLEDGKIVSDESR